MEKIDFSNGNTFGTMLVDSKWYDKCVDFNICTSVEINMLRYPSW